MFEVTVQQVDVEAAIAANGRPEAAFPREGSSAVWLVPAGPLTEKLNSPWTVVSSGDLIVSPLIPYKTKGRNPVTAMSLAVSLGCQAAATSGAPHPVRAHVLISDKLLDLSQASPAEDAFEFYLGIALQVQ